MALRCLLFTTNEEIVDPIWQVLAELGVEGETCTRGLDAVERVTTQLFQVVITDWDDQPEAAFLLKTARELKAAARPLTLAIVSDDARRPEALQAGANSVLAKPIRPEQVRDTMSTACQLLRAKQVPSQKLPSTPSLGVSVPSCAGAAAAPAFAVIEPEKLRAGEFLQLGSSAPSAQFDTERTSEVQKSMEQSTTEDVDALTELEPMAAAVQDAPASPVDVVQPQEPLTGWAALQARLTKPVFAPEPEAGQHKSEKIAVMSYEEKPSTNLMRAEESQATVDSLNPSEAEAELFAYASGGPGATYDLAEKVQPKRAKAILAGLFATACVVALAVPQVRRSLPGIYQNAVRAGRTWLNPGAGPLPQAVAQHDSFGQSGDEYKLPVPTNIPDATTDPSQIRIVPVIDPTLKPDKNAALNAGQEQGSVLENPTDQPQAASPDAQVQVEEKAQNTTSAADSQALNPTTATPNSLPPAAAAQANLPSLQASVPHPEVPAVRASVPPQPRVIPATANSGIPSSLKSQIASSTPEASGSKSPDAAMSSIEPVNLPEATVREFLVQPVDPEYPAGAKASGQRGTVVLQVLIGRDGTVQDAKFLQGSLVFARAAIDAVKQWRFRAYSMNGRAVSVQSVMTLTFKPPA